MYIFINTEHCYLYRVVFTHDIGTLRPQCTQRCFLKCQRSSCCIYVCRSFSYIVFRDADLICRVSSLYYYTVLRITELLHKSYFDKKTLSSNNCALDTTTEVLFRFVGARYSKMTAGRASRQGGEQGKGMFLLYLIVQFHCIL